MNLRAFALLALLFVFGFGCAPETPETPTPDDVSADTTQATAAAAPSTDIWLVALPDDVTALDPSGVQNITARAGYDNQPSFTPEGDALLFTAQYGEQTDIYKYDLEGETTTQLTRTTQSEYSATVLPDGSAFSVIQVEDDGTQRLWAFDRDGTNPRLVLEDVMPVGYHAWGDDETLGLFVLGDPQTFQVASTTTGQADTLASRIGRSIHKIPNAAAISFTQAQDEGPAMILRYDLATGSISDLMETRPERQDYAWLPDGSILMGDGSVLFRARPGSPWEAIADFGPHGVQDITRLAVDPQGQYLALVGSE